MRPCAGTISKASSGTGIDCEFNFLSCGAWASFYCNRVSLQYLQSPAAQQDTRARWDRYRLRATSGDGSQTIPVRSQCKLSQQNFAKSTGLGVARSDQDSKSKLA